MPTYVFKNTQNDEVFTDFMSISAMETYLQENPHIDILPSSPAYVDPYSVGRVKADSGFNEVLQRIKKENRGSTIQTGNLSQV